MKIAPIKCYQVLKLDKKNRGARQPESNAESPTIRVKHHVRFERLWNPQKEWKKWMKLWI